MYALFMTVILLFLTNSLPANFTTLSPSVSALLKPLPNFDSCVFIVQPNPYIWRFYNECPERLAINVCMTNVLGETKLYQSRRTIGLGGRYTIFTLYPVPPELVSWAASPFIAAIPPPCEIPKKTKSD